jgi:hypothetical protein
VVHYVASLFQYLDLLSLLAGVPRLIVRSGIELFCLVPMPLPRRNAEDQGQKAFCCAPPRAAGPRQAVLFERQKTIVCALAMAANATNGVSSVL